MAGALGLGWTLDVSDAGQGSGRRYHGQEHEVLQRR